MSGRVKLRTHRGVGGEGGFGAAGGVGARGRRPGQLSQLAQRANANEHIADKKRNPSCSTSKLRLPDASCTPGYE